MKRLKLFFACLLMAVLSIGQVWGTPSTYTWTMASGDLGTSDSPASSVSKGSPSTTWSVDWTWYDTSKKFLGFESSNSQRGLQIGKGTAGYGGTTLVLSTSGISGTITSVKVNSAIAGSGGANLSVQVGSSDFEYNDNTSVALSTTPTQYDFVGSASGTITITQVNTATGKGMYIKSIEVTYSTGGSTDPTVNVTPTSWDFGSVAANVSASKTFSISGSNLTSGQNLNISVPEGYSVSPNSISVSAATLSATDIIVSKNTETTGSYNGNMSISGAGLTSAKTVGLTMTVTTPPHSYAYTHDFTQISGFSSWGSSYAEHIVNYDILPATPDGVNDDRVVFTSANKQSSNITDRPVVTNGDVELKLLDNTKYFSAVKFSFKQWTNKAKTVTLQYSTDGGTTYSALNPAISSSFTTSTTGSTMDLECLSLPAKTNALKVINSGSNQIGYSGVSFDLVDKVTYSIGKSETGCTLSVTDGTSAITSAEEGDEVYVSIASTETGYENAGFVVKDAENNTITVTDGKFTMPDKNVTITATATKKTYTVTLSAANGKIQVGGVDKESITVAHGGTAELTAVPNTDFAFNGWTSSDGTKVALSGANDNPVTITVTGAATVTASFISTLKPDPGISWSEDSKTIVKGQTATLPSFINPNSLAVTYSSTNESVAEIDNDGDVTINGVGSTTIKATYTETSQYAGKEVSYTLTVKGRVTWHIIKDGVDAPESADYVKDAVPTKPTPSSCDASISLVGWTTVASYSNATTAPNPLYTGNVPAVTDNADYYAVWGVVEEGGWNEITSVANLTAGTYAICNSTYFMKAAMQLNQQSQSTGRIDNGAATPSITNGALDAAPAVDCQWILSINASDKYLIQNGDNYLAGTTAKNKATLTDDATNTHAQWTITRSNDKFVVENVGRASDDDTPANRYLRNNDNNGWACYSSTQGSDGAPRFFKYSADIVTDYTTNCVEPLTVATPAFTPDGSAAYYTSAQDVEISCATGSSTIYYTTDGTTTPDKTTGTPYTGAIHVETTTTIKAIAYVGDVASEVAEATFTIHPTLTTIQGIFDEATAIGGTAQARTITFDNWIVSAISSDDKSVYVTDNTKGFVIYVSGKDHGFAVGNVLSGTVECDLQLYAGFAEIKDLKASNTSLTVTTGGVLVPADAEIKNLGAVNTGAPVILSNVTYDSDGDLVDDESYYVKPDNMLYSDAVSTFEQDKIYNVTGVYVYGTTDKIAPRSAADIVKLSKEQQTITWYVSNAQAEAIGTSYSLDNKDVAFAPVCVSNSTGAKTYQSSNTEVATINENTGVIEVLGNGVTTITCNVVGDENYVDGSKAFTLKVGIGEASWVAATWATAESVASNTKMADKSPIAIDANLSMTWSKAEGSNDPIYHSDEEGRLYQKNTLTITASNSKQITRIEFHFTGNNTGSISANEGTYSNGVWTGFAPSVTFTNAPGASGAKIKSIDIEYAQGTTTTLVIDDMIILDNASATDIVFSSNKPSAVVVYSDYDDEVITIEDGKITPVAKGNTTVKASIAAEAPYSSVSITFNVRVKSSSETVENVVILSQFGDKWLAMKHDFTAVEVEKAADGTIIDMTCDEADITWVMTADGASAMFQQPSTNKYLAVGSSNALTLTEDPTIWTLGNDGYYYSNTTTDRTFLYQGTGAKFKNYSASNAGTAAQGGYSEYATFVTPVFANRAEIRTDGIAPGVWGTICPKKEVKYPAGASFYEISYVEYHSGVPYKVFYDEIAEGASLAAGQPYLFQADEESTAIKGIAVGDDATSATNDHGFIGVLENETISVAQADVDAYKYYIVYNNEIRLCGVGQFLIKAERAYLDMSDPNVEKQYKAPIAGRRRVALTNNAAQTATDIDEFNVSETPVKMIIDGQLYILRGEKLFDATGRLVK